jgi:NAD(P)-dependent dehydrogenase (short-subunit alcohol dehydrogenase family)
VSPRHIGRVGTTTDVPGAVIYLASPAGAMVSGHVLVVDGAWTAQQNSRRGERRATACREGTMVLA